MNFHDQPWTTSTKTHQGKSLFFDNASSGRPRNQHISVWFECPMSWAIGDYPGESTITLDYRRIHVFSNKQEPLEIFMNIKFWCNTFWIQILYLMLWLAVEYPIVQKRLWALNDEYVIALGLYQAQYRKTKAIWDVTYRIFSHRYEPPNEID